MPNSKRLNAFPLMNRDMSRRSTVDIICYKIVVDLASVLKLEKTKPHRLEKTKPFNIHR